jgi:hypothetical protein
MKIKIFTAALLLATANVANAGFFDSLFGNNEEATSTEAATTVADETSSTMETATTVAMGLLPTLTQQLGVTESQAEGGMGSLMQLAQGALSSEEFSELSDGVPNMSALLAAAPVLSSGDGEGGISDMLSSAGGFASSLGGMAKLTEQFKSLGLSADMIIQFANIAISYFSNDSSTNTGALLQKGLTSILDQ